MRIETTVARRLKRRDALQEVRILRLQFRDAVIEKAPLVVRVAAPLAADHLRAERYHRQIQQEACNTSIPI